MQNASECSFSNHLALYSLNFTMHRMKNGTLFDYKLSIKSSFFYAYNTIIEKVEDIRYGKES